jgi:integrase
MFSAFKSFKLTSGLHLEERPREKFLKARASLHGKSHFFNTATTDFDRAERLARSWHARLTNDSVSGSRPSHTMHEAAKDFIKGIRKPVTREYHAKVWSAISDFFKAVDVDAIDTPLLKKFVRWRRGQDVTESTVSKSLVTIRVILRHAVEEGWLDKLPVFPRLEKIETNPRPWLEASEWAGLLRTAEERIEDVAGNDRLFRQRSDLLDFCRLMVATCCRVDEMRGLRVRDVQVKVQGAGQSYSVDARTLQVLSSEYLEIHIHTGKHGERKTVTRTTDNGVEAFRRLVKRNKLTPDDLLFSEHHRDGFRELLIAAGSRVKNGRKRNAKALRCTGVMLWVLERPETNLKLLADNFGTSVAMLDLFYLKPLGVEMKRESLV